MDGFMDYGGVQQRLDAFDKYHGASLCEGGWILFEDGAMREQDPMGALRNPPEDPWELAKRKLVYQQILLKRALHEFDSRRLALMAGAHANLNSTVCGPAPSIDECTAELSALKEKVQSVKVAYEKAQAEVERHKPAGMKQREEDNLRNRKDNEDLLARLSGIEL